MSTKRYLVLAESVEELPYVHSRHDTEPLAWDAAENAAQQCPEEGVTFAVCKVSAVASGRVEVAWAAP